MSDDESRVRITDADVRIAKRAWLAARDSGAASDEEIRRSFDQYERAKRIIEENRDVMVRLSEALLERETLDGVQIRRIVAGLPLDDDQQPRKDDERPQLKEPASTPLKPILPPITGSNPATA